MVKRVEEIEEERQKLLQVLDDEEEIDALDDEEIRDMEKNVGMIILELVVQVTCVGCRWLCWKWRI